MDEIAGTIDRLADERAFSGVVRIDRPDAAPWVGAYGLADRRHAIPNAPGTRFAIASGVKSLTAVTVVSLIEDGRLALDTPARALLGDDLPLVGDDVTVEHLLSHTSGIGDYCDEDAEDFDEDALPPFAVQTLTGTEAYVAVLDGYPPKFRPGEGFSYCNGGFVVLALLAQRASGTLFEDLVQQRVCAPAGMRDTAFLPSDRLPGDAAVGYLVAEGLQTNVFHLPLMGSGDGGIYSTVADVHAFWKAFLGGALVSAEWVEAMIRPRNDVPGDSRRYGLGFWLQATGDAVMLEGADVGVSFRSTCHRAAGITHTVVSNTSRGAWPLVRYLADTALP